MNYHHHQINLSSIDPSKSVVTTLVDLLVLKVYTQYDFDLATENYLQG